MLSIRQAQRTIVASALYVLCIPVACSGDESSGGGVGTQCDLNTDCAGGLVCRLGYCRDECRGVKDCPLGSRCLVPPDETTGVCQIVEQDECAETEDCPNGLVCAFKECLYECDDNETCSGDSTCEEDDDGQRACLGKQSTSEGTDGSGRGGDAGTANGDAGVGGAAEDSGAGGGSSGAGGANSEGGTSASQGGASSGEAGDDSGGAGAAPASSEVIVSVADEELGGDFESGVGLWFAENGIWQVGTPSSGPGACFSGERCLATVLDGNYPPSTTSRFVSTSIQLPNLSDEEELQLRFMNWFSLSNGDTGVVQVSVWDETEEAWGDWVPVGISVSETSPIWTRKLVDLTGYQGALVRLAFQHEAVNVQGLGDDVDVGWYIDDLVLARVTPTFTGEFEAGWEGWHADRGLWQPGTPSAGPESCYAGNGCVGTVLDGNYEPGTDSRLVSASVTLPDAEGPEEVQLRFWHWFSFNASDLGEVQVSVWDASTEEWQPFEGQAMMFSATSTAWTQAAIPLTAYAGQRVRIAFYHQANNAQGLGDDVDFGWYIDNVTISKF